MTRPKPRIAVSMGDPAGVGPEICLELLRYVAKNPGSHWPVVVGDWHTCPTVARNCDDILSLGITVAHSIEEVAASRGPCWWDRGWLQQPPPLAEISPEAGLASFGYVEAALELVQRQLADAVVTGPIHKQAWQRAGIAYPGHTEFFVERCRSPRHAMMLTSPAVTCSLVTTHVGIADVSELLRTDRILEVLELTHHALHELLQRSPRLAVLGLNPHAGEDGRFGRGEEERVIVPAIDAARRQGWSVRGPLSPDTAFLPEVRRRTDAYVCMYHDQGLIPLKTLAFDAGVNVTLGLPIVRTSVDHGPAFDRIGSACATSMIAAYDLARQWVTMRSRSPLSRSGPCPPADPERR